MLSSDNNNGKTSNLREPSSIFGALRPSSLSYALLSLLLGLCFTFYFTYHELSFIKQKDAQHFQIIENRLKETILSRIRLYEYGLRGTRSALLALKNFTAADFLTIVNSRDLPQEFPGSLGIGYIERVNAHERDSFVKNQQADQHKHFEIKSTSKESDFLVIRFIEPLEENIAALGFDIGQEKNRRLAAELAEQTGKGTITAPIELVQAKNSGVGFLYMLPVYQANKTADSEAAQQKELRGWVYMPLLSNNIFYNSSQIVERELDFEIFDGANSAEEILIYDDDKHLQYRTPTSSLSNYFDRTYTMSENVPVGGRVWRIIASTSPFFKFASRSSAYYILGLGILSSIFISFAIYANHRSLQQAKVWAETSSWELIELKKIVDFHAIVSETDRKGIITRVNDLFCEISGYNPKELIGKTHRVVGSDYHPSGFWKDVWQTIKSGKVWNGVVCNKKKTGEEYWVRSTISPVFAGDKLKGFLSIRTDVTDLKKIQHSLNTALEKAKAADRSKSDFLANMSHEIRTPMNGVMGMLEQLMETEISSEQKDLAHAAALSAKSLLTIINDILDISKIEANKIVLDSIPVSLKELGHELEAIFLIPTKEKKVELITNFADDLPPFVSIDPVRIRQVLINLISNAIKFTPTGGAVIFQIKKNRQSENQCELLMSVSDTGIGVPQKEQARIFEAFTQADASTTRIFGGTGLGLSIAYNLVTLMGGKLELKSVEGVGSRFYFSLWLPIVAAPPTNTVSTSKATKQDASSTPLSILVAEDNFINQKLAKRIIEKQGHSVTLAANGLEAIEACETQDFDIILMDIQMPSMDGIKATQIIREKEKAKGKRVPIVALTANAMSGDRERFLAAGLDDYLPKPFQQTELLEIIYRLTEQKENLKT